MQNIQIDAGIKRITVNGDPNRVIEFNPEDILFVERFHNLIRVFEEKEKEYSARAKELQSIEATGLTDNQTLLSIQLVRDLCSFLNEQIDSVFGEGTSKAAFAGAQTLNMYEQFFEGIVPLIKSARSKKAAKYIRKSPVKKEQS